MFKRTRSQRMRVIALCVVNNFKGKNNLKCNFKCKKLLLFKLFLGICNDRFLPDFEIYIYIYI